jgi:hypothetical protein
MRIGKSIASLVLGVAAVAANPGRAEAVESTVADSYTTINSSAAQRGTTLGELASPLVGYAALVVLVNTVTYKILSGSPIREPYD